MAERLGLSVGMNVETVPIEFDAEIGYYEKLGVPIADCQAMRPHTATPSPAGQCRIQHNRQIDGLCAPPRTPVSQSDVEHSNDVASPCGRAMTIFPTYASQTTVVKKNPTKLILQWASDI